MDKTAALSSIKTRIENELVCELKDNATNMVFGKGNPDAPILFVGEAPGEKEDLSGLPFVGAAGKQLDKLLNSIGLTLDGCYVANILKYRPPKNRDPVVEEIRNHTPYLIEQIKVIKPSVICTLGNFSTKFVLAGFNVDGMKKIEGVSKLHGAIQHVVMDGEEIVVVPLYHPAACLYRPQLRTVLEEDFQKIKTIL